MIRRDWPRYAYALDLHLSGSTLVEIARQLGVSKERARQIVGLAKAQLAFRVFKGLPRPGLTEIKDGSDQGEDEGAENNQPQQKPPGTHCGGNGGWSPSVT